MSSTGAEVNGLVCGHSCGLTCNSDFHTARQFILFLVAGVPSIASGLRYGLRKVLEKGRGITCTHAACAGVEVRLGSRGGSSVQVH